MPTTNINLTPAEWRVMECLWNSAPMLGRTVTQTMSEQCGWSRSTTLTLLSRLETKGAIASVSHTGKKEFRPLICREDASVQETTDFLARVYNGSLSMMVSALTRKQALSQADIDELYDILKEVEGKHDV